MSESPVTAPNLTDPGDETARRYAYALAARELIDPQRLKDEYVVRTPVPLPTDLVQAITRRNTEAPHLLDIVSRDLARLPLFGINGLKDRTKFLSTRHDAS
ncbi:MAG: hypothetical protein H7Y06_04745 [Opitutaceae bacterium]|nr:hypothetical protein [Opitutaceae bacterium]